MTRRADPRTTRLPVRDIVAQGGEVPTFTPVPRKSPRCDGWTPERQLAFIEALADTGSVHAACKAVDMSQPGVYYLRRQARRGKLSRSVAKGARPRRAADRGRCDDRALNRVDEPLYSYGKLVGTRKRYNDRLLMFMLRNRSPDRFAEGAAKGLGAIGKMEAKRLRKKWRKEWEAEQRGVNPAEVRASIDTKITADPREDAASASEYGLIAALIALAAIIAMQSLGLNLASVFATINSAMSRN